MSELTFYFRRATLEDIEILRELWQTALLPIQELEKRLTEFQIVEGMDGRIFGALGAGVQGEEAWVHHEVFVHPEAEVAVRAKLWNRLKILFGNQSAHRVWTREKADFWKQIGFREPTEEEKAKFPADFGPGDNALLVYPLKDLKAERMIKNKIMELQAAREVQEVTLKKKTRIVRVIAFSLTGFFMVILIYYTIRGILTLPQIRP